VAARKAACQEAALQPQWICRLANHLAMPSLLTLPSRVIGLPLSGSPAQRPGLPLTPRVQMPGVPGHGRQSTRAKERWFAVVRQLAVDDDELTAKRKGLSQTTNSSPTSSPSLTAQSTTSSLKEAHSRCSMTQLLPKADQAGIPQVRSEESVPRSIRSSTTSPLATVPSNRRDGVAKPSWLALTTT